MSTAKSGAQQVERPRSVWCQAPTSRISVLIFAVLCSPLFCVLGSYEYLWTDVGEIKGRALVLSSLPELLSAFAAGIDGHYYRPTVFALHSIDHWIFGDNPAAFRATNLLLHVLNAGILVRLMSMVSGNRTAALFTGVLFAIHPLAVTPIAWIADRTDLLALFGSLAGAKLTIEYLRKPRPVVLFGVVMVLALALGAKETAGAIVVVGGVSVPLVSRRFRRPLVTVVVLQAIVVVLWFLWRGVVTTNSARGFYELGWLERAGLAAFVHLEYLLELSLPWRMTACDGRRVPGFPGAWALAGFVGLAVVSILVVRAWRRGQRKELFPLVWVAASLLPTSGLFDIKHVRADRYLYCALPGIIWLLVLAIRASFSNNHRRAVPFVISCAIYGYFATCLVVRSGHFRSNEEFWIHELACNDACVEGHTYLARAALERGDHRTALLHADEAQSLGRTREVVAFADYSGNMHHRGLSLLALGDLSEAKASFESVLMHAPPGLLRGEALYSLGLVAMSQDDFLAMERYLSQALSQGVKRHTANDALLLRSYSNVRLNSIGPARFDYQAYLVQNETITGEGMRGRIARQIEYALDAAESESVPNFERGIQRRR